MSVESVVLTEAKLGARASTEVRFGTRCGEAEKPSAARTRRLLGLRRSEEGLRGRLAGFFVSRTISESGWRARREECIIVGGEQDFAYGHEFRHASRQISKRDCLLLHGKRVSSRDPYGQTRFMEIS